MTITADTSQEPGRTGRAARIRPPSQRQQMKAQKRAMSPKERFIRRAPLLPALILTIVVTQLPFVVTLYYSTLDWNLLRPEQGKQFVGLTNYAEAFTDETFRAAALNTVIITASAVIFSMLIGVGCAVLLDRKFFGRGVVRSILLIPWIVPGIVAATTWAWMFHYEFGIINYGLQTLGIIDRPLGWLTDATLVKPSLVAVEVWKMFPFVALMVLAALQGIDRTLYEAARIDGARPLRRFWHITLPQLGPTLLFVALITMIGYFQLFVEPYVMTAGGPLRSTTSVVLLMYEEGFRWWRMGLAAAIAFVLFGVILTATLVQFRLQRRAES
jgi:multiple sugar transport system permease protein